MEVSVSGNRKVFSESDYRKSQDEYEAEWGILDAALYRLCRKNPDHASSAAVFAKVFIVGRTYSMGIERQVKSKGGQGSSISQVAERFIANHKLVDDSLATLSTIMGPLMPATLKNIVGAHG